MLSAMDAGQEAIAAREITQRPTIHSLVVQGVRCLDRAYLELPYSTSIDCQRHLWAPQMDWYASIYSTDIVAGRNPFQFFRSVDFDVRLSYSGYRNGLRR